MAAGSLIFTRGEYERRWRLAGEALAARGLQTAVVWGRTASSFGRAGDVIWLTNYFSTKVGQGFDTGPFNARDLCAVILRADREPELVADDPDVRAGTVCAGKFYAAPNVIEAVATSLKVAEGNGEVGFVGSDFLAMKYWRQLKSAAPGVSWRICDDLIRPLRMIKSPAEREVIRQAGETASRAMTMMMDALIGGSTETDAAALAASEIVRRGGVVDKIQISHGDTIGFTCGDPMAGYRPVAGANGDLVRAFLIGPMYQGYYLDPGRTAVVGKTASREQADLIEACAGIVEALADIAKPGTSFIETARLGDRMVADFGPDQDPAAEKFPFYGHVHGLYFESPPYISTVLDHQDAVFEEGMLIGIEAFLTRAGVGSAGFEQNYLVGHDGLELLTTTPMTWH